MGLGRACVSLGAQCHGPLATLSHNALGLSLSLSLSASLFLCVSLPLPASLFHSFLLSLSLRFCPSPVLSLPQLLQCSTALYSCTALNASPSHHPSPLPPQSAPHCDLRGRDRRARVVGSLATPHQLSRSTRRWRCISRGGGGDGETEGRGGGGRGRFTPAGHRDRGGQRAGGRGAGGGRARGAEGAERQRVTGTGNSLCPSLSLSARVSPFLRPPPAPGRSRQTRRQWHRREAHRGGGGRQSGSSSTVSRMPKSQEELQV